MNVWDLRSRNAKPIQTMSEATGSFYPPPFPLLLPLTIFSLFLSFLFLPQKIDSVTSVAVLDQEIISGSVDGVLRTYDLRKAKLLFVSLSSPSPLYSFLFHVPHPKTKTETKTTKKPNQPNQNKTEKTNPPSPLLVLKIPQIKGFFSSLFLTVLFV